MTSSDGGAVPSPRRTLGVAGFGEIEQEVYLAVLDAGYGDIGQIASTLGRPAAAVRGHLVELRERGYIAYYPGPPERYAAVDPRHFLTASADVLAEQAWEIRAGIAGLLERHQRARAVHDVEPSTASILTHEAAVVAGWYAELQHRAATVVRVFDRPPYLSAPMPELETRSLGRGVAHRAVYTPQSLDREGGWGDLRQAQASGEASRLVAALPMKLIIADETSAVICLSLQAGVHEALLTSSAPLIAGLIELFEGYWARGSVLLAEGREGAGRAGRAGGADGTGLDAQSRAIVTLIAAGSTDEAVAARLGVSVRSVRRRTSALMAQLGAGNRFQFGVLAERQGWL